MTSSKQEMKYDARNSKRCVNAEEIPDTLFVKEVKLLDPSDRAIGDIYF